MASGPIMLDPLCLVENKNKQLLVNQKALKILRKISQPVVVVAIVGPYRTGKSYLMNRLARENIGFPLGSTVQSKTKGIWMWCVTHSTKPDHTLVLLDTEGLGDVEKGDPDNDLWIFALAVLLSSTLIYNSMGTINNDALEKLHYVTKLTELIRVKSSRSPDGVEDATEFVSIFPDFIWAVRDFTLELEIDGHPITEDEYLEHALKLIPGDNPRAKNSNISRECITHFFPKQKCFIFDRPRHEKEFLACIEDVLENQLDPTFQEQSKNFCSYIFTYARTKTLRKGVEVTGNRLGTLVETYVNAINSGMVPCLENAVTTLAQLENSAAVQKAADHYSEQMTQRVRLPTDTLQELLDVHTACEKAAITVFMKHSFEDDKQEFQKKLVEAIKNKQVDFLLQNENESERYCQAQLDQLSKALKENILKGTFLVPEGYKHYKEAKRRIEWDYAQVPRKGVKANEVLQRFLKSLAPTEESILQADTALTPEEKVIAVDWAKKEAAKKELELLRQKQEELQRRIEAEERSRRENMDQLREKVDGEITYFLKELIKMLEHMLQLQQNLLNEGFKKKSEEMNAEINRLRNLIETMRNDKPAIIEETLLTFAKNTWALLCKKFKKLFSS